MKKIHDMKLNWDETEIRIYICVVFELSVTYDVVSYLVRVQNSN